MPKNFRNFALCIAVILTLFPYGYVLESSATNVKQYAILIIQLLCFVFTVIAYKHSQSRSLIQFWQFFSLAIISASIPSFIGLYNQVSLSFFFKDFTTLLSYFFILLAIESTPHLSGNAQNKHISGKVPAICFSVLCFCYFIIMPFEFAEQKYQTHLPSISFNLCITLFIVIRLSVLTIASQHNFWYKTYGLMTFGAIAILLNETISFIMFYQIANTEYFFNSSIQLLPYCALLFAANLSLIQKSKPVTYRQVPQTEIYILMLSVSLIVIHIVGIEFSLIYLVQTSYQSGLIIIWLFIAITLTSLSLYNRKKIHLKLKKHIETLSDEQHSLKTLNTQLNNSLVHSKDKAIVNASNNAILTCSVKGKVLSANPAAVQIFQCLEQELLNSEIANLFSLDDKMHYFFSFKSNVYALQRKDNGISIECTAKRTDSSEFPVQVELQWAEREEQPLIVITFINLTARKLAEKQTLELKDKFIANISHEFRTPLTIINGILDRYLIDAKTQQENEELTTAKRNGLRLVRMVEQLLELSRLTDNPSLTLSTYRLSTLMSMPSDSFSRLATQSNLTYDANIGDDLWLECDAQAFEKIIFNLLANAIKYTPSGGQIKVNAYQDKDTIILDVIDTGIGINKASQAKIFDRFQRADDDKNQAIFGVGIGLSLVNELVKAHQWRINLVSEYNQGSKFSLSIPLAQPVKIESSLPMSISENEVSSLLVEQKEQINKQTDHSQQVILVIEDNLDMQGHIKQVIEQKHHCLLASSGELGLTLAEEYLPDLIVCDIMLTGIDGFEVLKQLKDNDITSHIPIILLTARSDLDSRLHGLNLQADDYLSKPFNQQELLVRIDNLIVNRKQLQQSFQQKIANTQKEERKETSHQNVAYLLENDHNTDSINEQFLSKLEQITAEMYAETELGISHLANEMAMSERQLQRKIKVLLGTTPNNFIKEFRLRKAQALLKSGTQIGRIALDVGFSSQTYFGRCFKESFGCTPKQFQQKHVESS
ncbi:ATP-binding protein [Colwellia sp. RSH04]|uniref:ATP-binding protein n=1 Tax=Colwellia sp. RSH04 TaxID=2305464 RepID=UPI000E578465|nr:ATP-binding protein [Colwellia sp. RSH04]RHW75457.1 response regulator [Colwellia sp. RSH04]